MNADEVRERLKEIKSYEHDNESAHELEDELYLDFIKHVHAVGSSELKEIAGMLIKARNESTFTRWYQ